MYTVILPYGDVPPIWKWSVLLNAAKSAFTLASAMFLSLKLARCYVSYDPLSKPV